MTELLTFLLYVFIFSGYTIAGGNFIGYAIRAFKRKKYTFCGFNIMLTVWSIMLLVKTFNAVV